MKSKIRVSWICILGVTIQVFALVLVGTPIVVSALLSSKPPWGVGEMIMGLVFYMIGSGIQILGRE